LNDDVECQAGLFRGDDCDEEVPTNQRLIAEIRVKVRKESAIGKILADPEALARILSSKEGSPLRNRLKNIMVKKLSEDDTFVSFEITITEDTTATDKIDPDQASQQLASFLASDPSFVVENQTTEPPVSPVSPTSPVALDKSSASSSFFGVFSTVFLMIALIVVH
jgi:hypothetical protein